MQKTGLLAIALMLTSAIGATSPEKKGLEVINQTNAEAHIAFLASDALKGREAGSREGQIAGEYIVSNLKTLGIAPLFDSYYQPFEAYNKERQKRGRYQVHPDSIAKTEKRSTSEIIPPEHLRKNRGKTPGRICHHRGAL